jgi:uncharacterized membrane protein
MFGVPYHFLIVHFPIVLALIALLYDARGDHELGYRFSLGAAAAAGLAVISGLMLSGGRLADLTLHAGSGITGSLAAVVLAVLRYSSRARDVEKDGGYPVTWYLIQILAVTSILVAAISGHRATR